MYSIHRMKLAVLRPASCRLSSYGNIIGDGVETQSDPPNHSLERTRPQRAFNSYVAQPGRSTRSR